MRRSIRPFSRAVIVLLTVNPCRLSSTTFWASRALSCRMRRPIALKLVLPRLARLMSLAPLAKLRSPPKRTSEPNEST